MASSSGIWLEGGNRSEGLCHLCGDEFFSKFGASFMLRNIQKKMSQ